MSKALKGFSTRQTPQSEPIPGSTQVPNSAGGYSYAVDFEQRLLRFLILGSDGGTYYIDEQKLTKQNAMLIVNALSQGDTDIGMEIVDTIVEVSTSGRAPKNDPALFALALAASFGTIEVKTYAFQMLPRVARIGTHLFHFVTYMEQFRGWGELAVRGISDWYLDKPVDKLIREVTKYQQRDGWSHRDLMRLSHPKVVESEEDADIKAIRNDIFSYVVDGYSARHVDRAVEFDHKMSPIRGESIYDYMAAVEEIKSVGDPGLAANLIITHGLPREVVPTNLLNSKVVWEALLQNMPVMAMVRNLATMTRVGVLEPMSHYTRVVVDMLGDQKRLEKSRIHPLSVLSALLTYQAGKGFRGKNTWDPIREIVDALDAAFYLSFGNVEPVGKPIMLALDVSGSMDGGMVANVPGLTPRVASAAMALITANVEKQYMVTAFTEGGHYYRRPGDLVNPAMRELTISPRQRLDDVLKLVDKLPFGGTDCALPMLYASKKGYDLDGFVIYTDSETWAGKPHPSQALVDYRQKTGRYARMAVVGMVSNGFTIADPEDAGQMDVVGFDTASPNIISAFLRGEI